MISPGAFYSNFHWPGKLLNTSSAVLTNFTMVFANGIASFDIMRTAEKSLTYASKSCTMKLLRWGVAARLFRERQSSIRKEISRLFEIKRKTIASIGVGLFIFDWIFHENINYPTRSRL